MNPKLSAALASVIWGTSYICITQLLPHNPVFIAAVRALGGGIPLLLLSPRLPSRDWWLKIVLLGTLNCGVMFALKKISKAHRIRQGAQFVCTGPDVLHLAESAFN